MCTAAKVAGWHLACTPGLKTLPKETKKSSEVGKSSRPQLISTMTPATKQMYEDKGRENARVDKEKQEENAAHFAELERQWGEIYPRCDVVFALEVPTWDADSVFATLRDQHRIAHQLIGSSSVHAERAMVIASVLSAMRVKVSSIWAGLRRTTCGPGADASLRSARLARSKAPMQRRCSRTRS